MKRKSKQKLVRKTARSSRTADNEFKSHKSDAYNEQSIETRLNPKESSTIEPETREIPISRFSGETDRRTRSCRSVSECSALSVASGSQHTEDVSFADHKTTFDSDSIPTVTPTTSIVEAESKPVTSQLGSSLHQRRINKRELKALLKQTKKCHMELDEQIMATMDLLAGSLKACVIDLNNYPLKPAPIVSSPDKQAVSSAPGRHGSVGRPGARRGARRGRGRRSRFLGLSESATSSPPVSWVPLMLPFGTPSRQQSTLKPSSCVPWLRRLSEARVNRFVNNMQAIMGPGTCSEISPATKHQVVSSYQLPAPKTENRFQSSASASQPAVTAAYSEGSLACPTQEELICTVTTANTQVLSDSRELGSVSLPYEQHQDIPFTHPSRGRLRGRRPYNHRTAISSSKSVTQTGVEQSSRLSASAKPRSKPRISRELRGLVTWDAVIAQQKRLREKHSDETVDTWSKAQQQVDVTLAVAEDLLAKATNEEITSCARRTRQSSGNAISQGPLSETTSVTTTIAASEVSESVMYFTSKPADAHSTTRSGISTDSSSMASSELPLNSVTSIGHPAGSKRRLASPSSLMLSSTYFGDQQQSFHADDGVGENVGYPNYPETFTAKYSPISVDRESEAIHNEHTLSANESPSTSKLRKPRSCGSAKRRGKGHCRHQPTRSHQAPLDTDSSLGSLKQHSDGPASMGMKRRRHILIGSTPPMLAASDSEGLGDQSSVITPSNRDTSSGSPAISVSLRRTASSRSSVLPPRKRYKAGLDPAATGSPITISESLPEPTCTDANASIVLTVRTIPEDSASSERSISCKIAPAPSRSHKRGRPRRVLPAIADTTAVSPGPEVTSPAAIDRPKREAAVVGYASLVSANLNNNNNISMHMDSPSLRVSDSTENTRISDLVSKDEAANFAAPTITRGRGRPPKQKIAIQKSLVGKSSEETTLSEKVSLTGRRKRPAVALSPGGKTYGHTYGVQHGPGAQSLLPDSLPTPTTDASVVPSRRKDSPPRLDSHTTIPAEHTVGDTEHHRKVGRPRLKLESVAACNPKECKEPLSSNGRTVSVSIDSLPEHNSLFKGHSISGSIVPGVDLSTLQKCPIYEVFFRFLNEPDPAQPSSRLTSPFLYLPSPERYPEFYRFVISSYSGPIVRAHFTESLLRRIFPASSAVIQPDESLLYGAEFPCLCLASVAKWLTASPEANELVDKLGQELGLSSSEQALLTIDPLEAVESLPLLDAAVEGVLSVWEAFAGRRSWLGRRILRLRHVYATIRNQCAHLIADEYNQIVPPLKATAVLNMPSYRVSVTGMKKKSDRRTLERGAEVIRCLCGFRVEGGHTMVQCDHCASWQHLPCLWWALNRATLSQQDVDTGRIQLCRAILHAAQAAGLNEFSDPSTGGKPNSAESPYFCPICVGLTDLTLEYPRSLSAAMAMDDLDSVFSLQETTVEGEHEFWSLASEDGNHQIRTDDYAFVNRVWLNLALNNSTNDRIDFKSHQMPLDPPPPILTAYDRVIIRIYRLWKDSVGQPWMEGGLFLRPYDLPSYSNDQTSDAPDATRFWHHREVVYDETSRLVLPLSAWNGRCVVVSPSAYRLGRPADLLPYSEAVQFISGPDSSFTNRSPSESDCSLDRLVFVCDKLFERVPGNSPNAVGCRFDEISPGYLKINMRPYCFLRKPDLSTGRSALTRHLTASQLLTQDRFATSPPHHSSEQNSLSTEVTNFTKPKGLKLARVVDWLERKRQLSTNTVASPEVSLSVKPAVTDPQKTSNDLSAISSVSSNRQHRGRPRGSRRRTHQSVSTAPPSVAPNASGGNVLTSQYDADTFGKTMGVVKVTTQSDVSTSDKMDESVKIDIPEPAAMESTDGISNDIPFPQPNPIFTNERQKLNLTSGSVLCSNRGVVAVDTSFSVPPIDLQDQRAQKSHRRKRKRPVTRKRVASACNLIQPFPMEPTFFSDSELYQIADTCALPTSDIISLKQPSDLVVSAKCDSIAPDLPATQVHSPVFLSSLSPTQIVQLECLPDVNDDSVDFSLEPVSDRFGRDSVIVVDPVEINDCDVSRTVCQLPSYSPPNSPRHSPTNLSPYVDSPSDYPVASHSQANTEQTTHGGLSQPISQSTEDVTPLIMENPDEPANKLPTAMRETSALGFVLSDACSPYSSLGPLDDNVPRLFAESTVPQTTELKVAFNVESLAVLSPRVTSTALEDERIKEFTDSHDLPRSTTEVGMSHSLDGGATENEVTNRSAQHIQETEGCTPEECAMTIPCATQDVHSETEVTDVYFDSNATPILDEPGTSGLPSSSTQLSSELIDCISGNSGFLAHMKPDDTKPPYPQRVDEHRARDTAKTSQVSSENTTSRNRHHWDSDRRRHYRTVDHHDHRDSRSGSSSARNYIRPYENYHYRNERHHLNESSSRLYGARHEHHAYGHDRESYWHRDRSSSGHHRSPRRDYMESGYRLNNRNQRFPSGSKDSSRNYRPSSG